MFTVWFWLMAFNAAVSGANLLVGNTGFAIFNGILAVVGLSGVLRRSWDCLGSTSQ